MNAAEQLGDGLWRWNLGSYVEQAAFSRDASVLGFALGDGRIAMLDTAGGQPFFAQVHQGSCLGLAAHPSGGFVTCGDDGLLAYVSATGDVSEVARRPGQWMEHMTASPDAMLVGVSCGRGVILLDLRAGSMAEYGPHPAGVSGLAFSPSGALLAATHAGGVSLWDVDEERAPVVLELPGLSLAPAFSPDGSFLALGHQENQIHIVDLEPRKVFALSGLPAKPGRLAWSADGGYLLHTGVKAVLCWPVPGCFNQDPQPVAFAVQEEARMTAVCANARIPFAACGFSSGRILLAELKRFAAFPEDSCLGGPVTDVRWSAQGMHLAAGCEDGAALLLDIRAMLA